MLPLWSLPWTIGGWLLVRGLFRLRRGEDAIVGFSLGLTLQVWLANLLSHIAPASVSFWTAPGLVLIAGIAATVRSPRPVWPVLRISHWVQLGALTVLFLGIGRGLGVFDDYQNLPTVSLMAAGSVPPVFALDSSLRFGYHYFLLLFAAQLMRVGNIFPWTALDAGRALLLALPLTLVAIWLWRLTRNRYAVLLGTMVVAFSGGARWLLLLLPTGLLLRLSESITLIGSAASSAPNLAEALISNWSIDGAGPIPFPFAFHSGINQAYVMAHTGIAGSGVLILMLLLLTYRRWKNRAASMVTVALLSALALANEIAYLLLGLGLLLSALAAGAGLRASSPRRHVALWLAIPAASLIIALLQGGMLTEIARTRLFGKATDPSYFDATPSLVWPPALVSAHMGALSITNPWQLLVALAEMGPVVLISPLVLLHGWKALKRGRWLEAGLVASSVGIVIAALVSFRGALFTAAPRLLSNWFLVCALYFVPLGSLWSARKGESIRIGIAALGLAGSLGGLVLFGVQLAAIQKPIYATFIAPADAKMAAQMWNQLEPEALVFDPLVFRAPTVLGRATRSSQTWYTRSPEWEALRDAPNPNDLRRAGFSYAYFDGDSLSQLSPELQRALSGGCVKQVMQVEAFRSLEDNRSEVRQLLDLRGCSQ